MSTPPIQNSNLNSDLLSSTPEKITGGGYFWGERQIKVKTKEGWQQIIDEKDISDLVKREIRKIPLESEQSKALEFIENIQKLEKPFSFFSSLQKKLEKLRKEILSTPTVEKIQNLKASIEITLKKSSFWGSPSIIDQNGHVLLTSSEVKTFIQTAKNHTPASIEEAFETLSETLTILQKIDAAYRKTKYLPSWNQIHKEIEEIEKSLYHYIEKKFIEHEEKILLSEEEKISIAQLSTDLHNNKKLETSHIEAILRSIEYSIEGMDEAVCNKTLEICGYLEKSPFLTKRISAIKERALIRKKKIQILGNLGARCIKLVSEETKKNKILEILNSNDPIEKKQKDLIQEAFESIDPKLLEDKSFLKELYKEIASNCFIALASLKPPNQTVKLQEKMGLAAKEKFEEIKRRSRKSGIDPLEKVFFGKTFKLPADIQDTIRRNLSSQISKGTGLPLVYETFSKKVQDQFSELEIAKNIQIANSKELDEATRNLALDRLGDLFLMDLIDKLGEERETLLFDILSSLEQTVQLYGTDLLLLQLPGLQPQVINREVTFDIPKDISKPVNLKVMLDYSSSVISTNPEESESKIEAPHGIRGIFSLTISPKDEERDLSFEIESIPNPETRKVVKYPITSE